MTFSLPQCLQDKDAREAFRNEIAIGLASGEMPELCLIITPATTDKDIYQAIQTISAINKFLEVSFKLGEDVITETTPKDHPAWGYLKICQSWLPNAHIVM